MGTLLSKRRQETLWGERPNLSQGKVRRHFARRHKFERGEKGALPTEVFQLRGLYVFDPARATSADLRCFMWSGLRVLRTQAEARGLSEDQVHHLLVRAFEAFDDAANSMWTTLRFVMASRSRNIAVAYEEVALSQEDAEVLRQIREAPSAEAGKPIRPPRRMQDG